MRTTVCGVTYPTVLAGLYGIIETSVCLEETVPDMSDEDRRRFREWLSLKYRELSDDAAKEGISSEEFNRLLALLESTM